MELTYLFDYTNNIFNGALIPAFAKVTVTQDGVVNSNAAGTDALILGGAPDTVIVNGVVCAFGNASNGINFFLPAVTGRIASLTVGATGVVQGTAKGVQSSHAVNVNNAGFIYGGSIAIAIDGGTDAYTITNSGHLYSDGINAITMAGSGTHTLKNAGLIDGFVIDNATNANDIVTNSGTINGDVTLNDGVNKFTNTGDLGGSIGSGSGNDVFTNSGHVFGAIVDTGGNNSLSNKGHIDSGATFSGGNNTLSNTGTIGDVLLGSGNDKVTNSGTMDHVALGNGDNTLSNSGYILEITGGSGKDVITNTGTVNNIMSFGAQDDKFTGGSHVDRVIDEGGKDTYSFGSGNDHFYAVGTGSGDANVDTVDGGSNDAINIVNGTFGDIYDATGAINGVQINLDTVQHQAFVLTLAANKATGTDVGTDTVKNFEEVIGGGAGDVIYGSASANRLDGAAGSDVIYGGGGNDWLIGGTGSDILQGGAGADKLWGGLYHSSGDGEQDIFSFHAISDSTVAVTGRDTINGFDDGTDLITFYSAMGLGSAVFIGSDVAFTGLHGTLGEVRAVSVAEGWTIQVDTNGDKKIDMAIDVDDFQHAIHWGQADFNFQYIL